MFLTRGCGRERESLTAEFLQMVQRLTLLTTTIPYIRTARVLTRGCTTPSLSVTFLPAANQGKRPYHTIIPCMVTSEDTGELFATMTNMVGYSHTTRWESRVGSWKCWNPASSNAIDAWLPELCCRRTRLGQTFLSFVTPQRLALAVFLRRERNGTTATKGACSSAPTPPLRCLSASPRFTRTPIMLVDRKKGRAGFPPCFPGRLHATPRARAATLQPAPEGHGPPGSNRRAQVLHTRRNGQRRCRP